MMLFSYKHHIVRDLAWAILSPALLIPEKLACSWYRDEWYQDLYASSLDWLQRLDKAPQVLQETLDSQKDRRLGRYFETLWAFWLQHSPRFEVLEQNLPLRADGKTLGELDFLVLDKASGQILHWEMAVKFYLGVADTRQHSNWHGPGKKDRLDLKVEHLRQRQSVISQRPQAQALLQGLGYQVDVCGVILKGRLFYPYAHREQDIVPHDANPQHLRSYWLTLSELQKECSALSREEQCFSPLVGYGWMASAMQDHKIAWLSLDELLKALKDGDFRLPLYLSCKQQTGVYERFFVVTDRWLEDVS